MNKFLLSLKLITTYFFRLQRIKNNYTMCFLKCSTPRKAITGSISAIKEIFKETKFQINFGQRLLTFSGTRTGQKHAQNAQQLFLFWSKW